MLEIKYLYDVTYLAKGPIRIKASKYIGNPVYFERDYNIDRLFCLLYSRPYIAASMRTFKVVPVGNEG